MFQPTVSLSMYVNIYECFRLSFPYQNKRFIKVSEMSPYIKYTAFCVNCEEGTPGSKVPLEANYVTHILTKCHINIIPINEAMPTLRQNFSIPIFNVTFSQKWNRKVTRLYVDYAKQLLKTCPKKVVTEYKRNKKCLKPKCSFQTKDPIFMLKHIRNHVKENISA